MRTELVGQQLGEFEVIRELGRGGMGVVYEARQRSLNRRVALKVLAPGLSLRAIARFRLEAESAGKLHHTNIVPVYATGDENGYHFYAMELIDGPSLDRVIREMVNPVSPPALSAATTRDCPPVRAPDLAATPATHAGHTLPDGRAVHDEPAITTAHNATPPVSVERVEDATPISRFGEGTAYFDTVARMIADVADALHHAHSNNVIHRDIKPGNLLLSADGRLSVNDFGLARALEEPGMTATGEIMGTPSYMAPEQIAGDPRAIDHRCDIYSLGATLYELLTLRPPLRAERRDQLLAMVMNAEPTSPRTLNPQVPRDLETICMKCLEKSPARRYQTAKELAEDLRRFVNRFAISAKRATVFTRVKKWMRRNPAAAIAGFVVLVAALAVAAFGYSSHLANRRAEESQRLHDEAMRKREEELRDDRRKDALEKAVIAAMGGRFAEAEKAVDQALSLGASAGEVRLLRGQIAVHRGQMAEAREHLEEAVRLLPQSVAARSVLVRWYHDAGQYDRFYALAGELHDGFPPVTHEDFLFKGQVLGYYVPREATGLLDRAVAERDSVLARLVRADIRGQLALDSGNLADAELAVEDARVARALLPDDPVALAVSVEVQIIAAGVYEELGRTEDRRAVLAQAERDVRGLQAFPAYSKAVRARITYFETVGNEEGIRAEYLRAPERAHAHRAYHLLLFRQGKFPEALDVVEKASWSGNEVIYHIRRGLVLAHLPDGLTRALAEYDKARKAGDGRLYGRGVVYPPVVLLLLGKQKEAAAFYREKADIPKTPPTGRSAWYHAIYEHVAGRRSAEQVIAAAGTSRLYQCEGHFFIAMNLLAAGDRVGARIHFEKCVTTRAFWFMEYEWSRVFLQLMKTDPNWPPWIPTKKA